MQKNFRMKKERKTDLRQRESSLCCALCGGEIYGGEYYYRLEGRAVCECCLERFARRYFSGERLRAEEDGVKP